MKKIIMYTILSVILYSFFQCRYDATSRIGVYFERNESKIEKLRNWDIYFEPERDFWSCRHWNTRDSLCTFVFVRVDKYNNVKSCDICSLHDDSATIIQMALQNISTLYEIRKLCKSKSIGTHEVEIFNDTLSYDYVINMEEKKSRYQIMLMKQGNNTIGHNLYKKWYIKKE